jgi:membrane-bound metal-dependent hydrolase YbcI (DUF457 family)
MLPDIEIPVLFLFFMDKIPNRLILHSLLGAATIGTILSAAFTVIMYPTLISIIFPIDKTKLRDKCKLSGGLVFSCLLGNLSHVLLDTINHPYNPIFWPFLSICKTPSPICFALGGMENASLILHSLLAVLFLALFINQRAKFWERLLVE